MNKIFLFLFLISTNFLFAQTQSTSYTLSDDSFSVAVPFSDVQADQYYVLGVDGVLANNTSDSVASNWIRTVQYLTTGWTTSVCDPIFCYGESTNTADFVFLPDTSANIRVDFSPHQLSGYGVVKVNFRKQGSISDFVEGTFIGRVDAENGISTVEKLQGIKLFPNPAKDKIIIVTTSLMLPVSIEVYDILGKKINSAIVNEGENIFSADITTLKGGFYFLRMKLSNGSVVTRQFTKS